MSKTLPLSGEWHLSNPVFHSNPPFALLRVDLLNLIGTVRYLQTTTALTGITQTAPDTFTASYTMGKDKGSFTATCNDDGTLNLTFTGTVTTSCLARPVTDDPSAPPVPRIAARYKGTYDLASAAEALFLERVPFIWSNEGTDLADADSPDRVFDVRRMSCYEFVHFTAYLAGRQLVFTHGTPKIGISDAAAYDNKRYTLWDRKSVIPRGKVVIGVARTKRNNVAGYFHIGVSVGNGWVVSLWGGGLQKQATRDLFSESTYSEVRIADYPWAKSQFDDAAPLPQGVIRFQVLTTTLRPGQVGKPYIEDLRISGRSPFHIRLLDGTSLPAGLNLGNDGKFSGSPAAAGKTQFRVAITDDTGGGKEFDYTLEVK